VPPGRLFRLADRSRSPNEKSDKVLVARGIGVRYDLNFKRRRTFRDAIDDFVHRRRNRTVIWAIRGIDLEVGPGDAVGIVGSNGAGKSTLMLVLAGILRPDEGSLEIRGRVGALLALGVGFDRELSGRENIQLALAFMGIDGRASDVITPGIIDFADLGAFIDAPARTYSTGMRARLGFAVATAVEPEILVIDEVLSTGDVAFRARSRERIEELVHGAHAAVIVTHDLEYVVDACTRAIWLDHGAVAASGDPRAVVAAYRAASERHAAEAARAALPA
jgi:ABC-type polysaccharide/polyol phosphate transport system ATPase subunit